MATNGDTSNTAKQVPPGQSKVFVPLGMPAFQRYKHLKAQR
jgi:hypothetical protein